MRGFIHGGLIMAFLAAVLSPCGLPAQNGPPDQVTLTKEEQLVVDLTNAARKKENLPPYQVNAILTKVARAYSVKMAEVQKLDHFLDVDGAKVLLRVKNAKYPVHKVGENLGAGDLPVPKIFEAWMDSPKHRLNILFPDYTEIGVGVAQDAKGQLWYTQVFARPKTAS